MIMALAGLAGPYTSVADAIQRMEGYYPGSLAYQNNNPGNLIYGDFAKARGAVAKTIVGADGKTRTFAAFPTYEQGRQAEEDLIDYYATKGYTLQSLLNAWAPASDGNSPSAYTANVSKWTGIDPATPLLSVAGNVAPTPTGLSVDPTDRQASMLPDLSSWFNPDTVVYDMGVDPNAVIGTGTLLMIGGGVLALLLLLRR